MHYIIKTLGREVLRHETYSVDFSSSKYYLLLAMGGPVGTVVPKPRRGHKGCYIFFGISVFPESTFIILRLVEERVI